MKVTRGFNILAIILAMVIFSSCSTSGVSEQDSLCKSQSVVKKEVKAILDSLTVATTEKDYQEILRLVDTYYADDVVIKSVNSLDPNRREQITPLAQVKYMISQMPGVIFDYKQQFKSLQIEAAADCQSAVITGSQLETTTMSSNVAFMMAPYLFKENSSKRYDDEATIESEEKFVVEFKKREGNWFIIRTETEVISAKLK